MHASPSPEQAQSHSRQPSSNYPSFLPRRPPAPAPRSTLRSSVVPFDSTDDDAPDAAAGSTSDSEAGSK